MPSKFLVEFESNLGVGSTKAARLLGVAYPTYAAYRSMSRVLPEYHIDKVILLKDLSPAQLRRFMEWKFNGDSKT